MTRCVILLVFLFLMMIPNAQSRTISWELSEVTDRGQWSESGGMRIAISIVIDGIEVARVWDNPGDRSFQLSWEPDSYCVIAGRLYGYAAPYPDQPGPGGVPLGRGYQRQKRRAVDGLLVDIPRNRVQGHGLVHYGPSR